MTLLKGHCFFEPHLVYIFFLLQDTLRPLKIGIKRHDLDISFLFVDPYDSNNKYDIDYNFLKKSK